MSFFKRLGAVSFLAALLAAPAFSFEIKFATLAPEGSTWMNVMREFDRDLRKKTDGRVGFKIYPGGVSGDEKDVVRKIRFGQLHAAGFTGVGLGEILPEVRLFDLPFLFGTVEEVDAVRKELTGHYREAFKKKGFVLLAWADVGFVHFFSNEPIRTPADLKKAKPWMWEGDPIAQAFMESLGVSAVPLAVPEVLSSLQTGLVDAVYSSPLGAIALQWFTRVKYMSEQPMTYASGAVLMHQRAFKKLSPADQKTLLALAAKHLARMNELTRKDNLQSIETMRKRGIKRVSLSDKELGAFRETGLKVRRELTGSMFSKGLLDRARKLLAEYRVAAGGKAEKK